MKKFNIAEMENYEINQIKDDLVVLENQLNDSRDADVLAKAFYYINYLEEKLATNSNDIDKAKTLLQKNDFAVIKKRKEMVCDEKECLKLSSEGKSKDCLECRCFVCAMEF